MTKNRAFTIFPNGVVLRQSAYYLKSDRFTATALPLEKSRCEERIRSGLSRFFLNAGIAVILLGALLSMSSVYAKEEYPRWLAIGDSITEHGPAEQLKWAGESRGMAASERSKDYVHLLLAMLREKHSGNASDLRIAGRIAQMKAGTIEGVLGAINELCATQANLVTIQLGENDRLSEIGSEEFSRRYRLLVEKLMMMPSKPKIVCTGVWAPGGPTENGVKYKAGCEADIKECIIEKICKEKGLSFVSVAPIALNPANHGYGETSGVQWHPNDAGMRAYAEAIFGALFP